MSIRKDLKKSIQAGLLFYLLLFAFQCALFFIIPPFYVSSPQQSQVPVFIKWSFGKYFGGILLLYLAWGCLLGFLNTLLFRLIRFSPSTLEQPIRFLLGFFLGQFLFYFATIGIEFPSIFNQYPLLREVPLWMIDSFFIAIAMLALLGAWKRSPTFSLKAAGITLVAALIPAFAVAWSAQPSPLQIAQAPNAASAEKTNLMLLGFDALDGDTGSAVLEPFLQENHGLLYTNAFTPIPLTHPAWNSILSGFYPSNHRVRFFFGSPNPPNFPGAYLPERLNKEQNYSTLFISDQPETSYFNGDQGFSQHFFKKIGWDAHLTAMMLNHFILPAWWLNNGWVEQWTQHSFNTPSVFNYDLNRFFNFAFEQYGNSISSPRFLALHSCYLHSPIRLNRRELASISGYLRLSPKMFSFSKWPKPGEVKEPTPNGWVNPYFIRRKRLTLFLDDFLQQLKRQNYLEEHLIVFLSDHGERFVENYEIYGGIHGVDLKTRQQNNVVFGFLGKPFTEFHRVENPVSLIDITPSLLRYVGLPLNQYPYDGLPLWDKEGKPESLPLRPLYAESMGWIDNDSQGKGRLPELSLQSLEENLSYYPDGRVVVSQDYYKRILKKKQFLDLSKNQEMLAGKAVPNRAMGGATL